MFLKAVVSVLLFAVLANAQSNENIERLSDAVVKDLDGYDTTLGFTRGKCTLIINTGSGCGLTNANMKWLNHVSRRFPELVVVAFPSNSFNQEKKTEEELKDYFFNNWGAKYNVMGKTTVKQNDASPLYKWLIQQSGKAVIWNYGKYLVQKDGTTVDQYGPQAGAVRGISDIVDLITGSSIEGAIRKCLRN